MKNAIVYKAHLPAANHLGADLAEHPWREIASHESIRHAFIEGGDGFLVQTYPGGYAICLRTDEKILPSSVVKAEVERRVKAIETGHDRVISKAERGGIKEEVVAELLKRALVKQRYTWAYYDVEASLLFVDGGKKDADALMVELVQACASVKTETIHIADIKMGLTTRLRETIEDEEGEPHFGAFSLGTNLRLSRKTPKEPTERVVYTDSEILNDDVLAQLQRGFWVEQLEIGLRGVFVRLTKDFHFKRFDWPEMEPMEELDAREQWDHDTSVKVVLARDIVLQLCEMMEYQPPKLEDEAA